MKLFGQTAEDAKVGGIKIQLNALENNLRELKAALENGNIIRQSKETDVTALEQALTQAACAIGDATQRFMAPFYVNLGEHFKQYLK